MSICSLNQSSKLCLPNIIIQKLQKEVLDTNHKDDNNIMKELADNTKCNINTDLQSTELCILQKLKKNTDIKDIVDNAIITYFKPITKSYDANYWLNNSEIDHIQHQLLTLFEGYYYSNIHMIDLVMFDPHHSDKIPYNIYPITEINFINECKKENCLLTHNGDLNYYGIVFNTDTSNNSGLHWFSIFIDFTSDPINIEYFNSSGYDIKNRKFKEYLINLADEISKDVRQCKFVKVTDIEHQRSDTANCGSFSLFYIWSRLNGKPYSYFTDNKITDERMQKFREFLFRLK